MNAIERGWYNASKLNYLLAPLTLLFWLVSSVRRALFRLGLLKSIKVGKPVIVVGNISVGGNGKTPFVLWLVDMLAKHDIKAGVISRGYGGKAESYPIAVDERFDPSIFGDEPVLIHKRSGCPVVVGSDRIKSSQLLIQQFDCDVIISDDGMQHYRLDRDIEVAIIDAARLHGNGWLMPVGPLRELPSRLKQVDHVVYNGVHTQRQNNQTTCFTLQAGQLINVLDNNLKTGYQNLAGLEHGAYGLCGIGNPARFEQTLNDLNIKLLSFTPFADHHHFTAEDFAQFGDSIILMTEKDAVKCQAFAQPNWWYLAVDATLPTSFEQQLLTQIQQVITHYGI